MGGMKGKVHLSLPFFNALLDSHILFQFEFFIHLIYCEQFCIFRFWELIALKVYPIFSNCDLILFLFVKLLFKLAKT